MPVVIQNPILNSPFNEPTRHFRFDENDQITDQIDRGRRPSVSFHPVPAPKKKAKAQQFTFDSLLEPERKEESAFINRVRAAVKLWSARRRPARSPSRPTRW